MVDDGSRKGWLKNASAKGRMGGNEDKTQMMMMMPPTTTLTKVHPVLLIPLQQSQQKVTELRGRLARDAGQRQTGSLVHTCIHGSLRNQPHTRANRNLHRL